ncbi:MAG: hypothetical protein P8Z74_10845, partial [Acidobacteriota bacterium]
MGELAWEHRHERPTAHLAALVDILQPCVTFNRERAYDYDKERVYKLQYDPDYDPGQTAIDGMKAWYRNRQQAHVLHVQGMDLSQPGQRDGNPAEHEEHPDGHQVEACGDATLAGAHDARGQAEQQEHADPVAIQFQRPVGPQYAGEGEAGQQGQGGHAGGE